MTVVDGGNRGARGSDRLCLSVAAFLIEFRTGPSEERHYRRSSAPRRRTAEADSGLGAIMEVCGDEHHTNGGGREPN